VPSLQLFHDIGPATVASAITLAAGFGLVRLGTDAGLPVPLLLVMVGTLGVAVYGVLLWRLFPSTFADIAMLAIQVLPERLRGLPARIRHRRNRSLPAHAAGALAGAGATDPQRPGS
jgi:hypothetical protein